MIKKLTQFLFKSVLICSFIILGINAYMILQSSNKMIDINDINSLDNIDTIIVLGCGLKTNETPSDMLAERLDRGIELYHYNVSDQILMSGDHSNEYHNEVNVMKNYALQQNVSSYDIQMDHKGYSTYESMYRAKELYNAKNVVIVTQEYHLYRAVYIANQLGLNAYGVSSDNQEFDGQFKRDMREILARTKDFVYTIIQPEPAILGEIIPSSYAE